MAENQRATLTSFEGIQYAGDGDASQQNFNITAEAGEDTTW